MLGNLSKLSLLIQKLTETRWKVLDTTGALLTWVVALEWAQEDTLQPCLLVILILTLTLTLLVDHNNNVLAAAVAVVAVVVSTITGRHLEVVQVVCPLVCLQAAKVDTLQCTTPTTQCTTPRWQEVCSTECRPVTECHQDTAGPARTVAPVDTGAGLQLEEAGAGVDLPDVEHPLGIPPDDTGLDPAPPRIVDTPPHTALLTPPAVPVVAAPHLAETI